jgi:lysophospholipase L1-like esterase
MYTEEQIVEEIKNIGNTNLITNSCLLSGSQVFAIGDSHTIFYYNSLKIKEHWFFGGKLPLTIYRLLNEDLDIYNIGNNLGNHHEKYNIRSGDYVIFYFGFNDIQKNIHAYNSSNWEEAINKLFTSYVNKIVNLKYIYYIKPIVSCIYPNPRPEANGVNSCGTYEERKQYTILANFILKNLSNKQNLNYLDIYNIISDDDGFIKKEITYDNIHLDYNNKILREIVETEIFKFCN